MDSKDIATLLILIGTFAFAYILCSFVETTFLFYNWHIITRIVLILVSIIIIKEVIAFWVKE
jgi:hypothetical protein